MGRIIIKKDASFMIRSTLQFKKLIWETARSRNQTLSEYVNNCIRDDLNRNGVKFNVERRGEI